MTRAALGSVAWEKRDSSSRMGDSGAHGSGWYGCWYTGVFGIARGAFKETRVKREAEEDRDDVRARFLGGDETVQGETEGLGCGMDVPAVSCGQGDTGLTETDRRQALDRAEGEEMGFC